MTFHLIQIVILHNILFLDEEIEAREAKQFDEVHTARCK